MPSATSPIVTTTTPLSVAVIAMPAIVVTMPIARITGCRRMARHYDLSIRVRGSTRRVAVTNAYSDEHRPLAAYGLLTAAFGALFGGGAAVLHERLPDRPRADDVALAAVATYKISRLLAKDRV